MLPAFGTDVGVAAELAVGHAGQADPPAAVRVGPPGAVEPAAALVEVPLVSVLICETGRSCLSLHILTVCWCLLV